MRARLLATLLVLGLLAGCGTGARVPPVPAAAPPAAPRHPPSLAELADASVALVAALRGPTPVLRSPGGPRLLVQDGTTDEGTRQRLLVAEDRGEWLRVLLPGRPAARTGWIRAGDADLSATDYRLRVSLSHRTLTVERGLMVTGTWPVAVGAPATPTPTGLFYVTDLLRPPAPDGPYGPYAFGLSAYSPVLTSFGTGRGQIGVHGTDEPQALGRPVSHGCVRLPNEAVRALAGQLPLGTPVVITA